MILLAKDYVSNKNEIYAPIDCNVHSNDFVFCGGVIDPLKKDDYCTIMTKLLVFQAFDLSWICH